MVTGSVTNATSTFTKGDGSTFDLTVDNVANATSASYALTASYAANAVTPTLQQVTDQGASTTNIITLDGGAVGDATLDNNTVSFTSVDDTTAQQVYFSDSGFTNSGNIQFDPSNGNLTISSTGTTTFSGNATTATSATDATNADNVALDTDTTNADRFVPFAANATGDNALKTDAGIKYNPSTNKLTIGGDLAIGGIADVSASIADAASGTIDTGSFVSNAADTYGTTPKIQDVITLTQGEYNAITTPDNNTLYVINDATGSLVVSASHALVADTVASVNLDPYIGVAQFSGSIGVTGSIDLTNTDVGVGPVGTANTNVIIGAEAGESLTSGANNTFVGGFKFAISTGGKVTSQSGNTAIGAGAGGNGQHSNSIFIGESAGLASSTAMSNTVSVGNGSLRDGYGNQSVFIGKWSGYGAANSNGVAIGYRAGWTDKGASNIFIGQNVVGQGGSNFTNSNYIAVGSDLAPANNLIYGYHGADTTAGDRFLTISGLLNLPQQSADPTGAGVQAGSIYYNTTTNKARCYNGTTWNDMF